MLNRTLLPFSFLARVNYFESNTGINWGKSEELKSSNFCYQDHSAGCSFGDAVQMISSSARAMLDAAQRCDRAIKGEYTVPKDKNDEHRYSDHFVLIDCVETVRAEEHATPAILFVYKPPYFAADPRGIPHQVYQLYDVNTMNPQETLAYWETLKKQAWDKISHTAGMYGMLNADEL